ncbi:MAG: hypothetical protein HQ497_15450, partial [SAR86 cluster bacterium]|nr:hypothetical protein [SAR86 cluster bacterium]
MLDLFDNHDEAGGILFRDVLSLALMGFLAVIVLLLPYINPRGDQAEVTPPPPGNVIVEITWASELNADVDLWIQAPNDLPVGYSNKGAVFFNLLRDDLGQYMDPTMINHEVAYTRGIIPGEYVINIHAYRGDHDKPPPMDVRCVISIKLDGEDGPMVLPVLGTTARLDYVGQEITVFRFTLNEK